jgi:hypothetical protein
MKSGEEHVLGEHAKAASRLGEITTRNIRRRLIADTQLHVDNISDAADGTKREACLETRRAPVHELDRPLRLDAGDGGLNILGNDITTIQKAARH